MGQFSVVLDLILVSFVVVLPLPVLPFVVPRIVSFLGIVLLVVSPCGLPLLYVSRLVVGLLSSLRLKWPVVGFVPGVGVAASVRVGGLLGTLCFRA